jgi:hypothetical protein
VHNGTITARLCRAVPAPGSTVNLHS